MSPGYWLTVANYVSDHSLLFTRIDGTGPMIDDLEWDVKLYLAINGAIYDTGRGKIFFLWELNDVLNSCSGVSFIDRFTENTCNLAVFHK